METVASALDADAIRVVRPSSMLDLDTRVIIVFNAWVRNADIAGSICHFSGRTLRT